MLVLFDFLLMGVCKIIKYRGSKLVYEGKFGLDRGGGDRKEVEISFCCFWSLL